MKALPIVLAALLLAGCKTDPSDRLGEGVRDISDRPEVQAIRALLENIEPDDLKHENFGVIIGNNSAGIMVPISDRPATIVTWFRFAYDKEFIRLSYLSFPKQEEYGGPFDDAPVGKRLTETLMKIANDKGTANLQNVRQFRIFTPGALKNDAMLNDLFQTKKKNYSRLDGGSFYYWGFKTKKKEIIAYSNYYSNEFLALVEEGILEYIIGAISHYDTPDEWKIRYISEWKAWAYPHEYATTDDRICYYNPKFELLKRVTK